MTEKAAPCVLWSWMLATLAMAVPLTALLAAAVDYLPLSWRPILWTIWGGVLLLFGGIYLPLRRRNLCYALTDECIQVTGGVFFLTTRRIRCDAVRQVTLLQGPIERRCGTVFLLVSGTGGYLLAEGLPLAQAENWCRRLCSP
jgi:membrane protein YdbS with pleckstrin-like domain